MNCAMQKSFLHFILCTAILLQCISCAKSDGEEQEEAVYYPQGNYGSTYKLDIIFSPINAFSPSLHCEVLKITNGLGEEFARMLLIDWRIDNMKLGFEDVSVSTMETKLEEAFAQLRCHLYLTEDNTFFCCLAGVSQPIRIYADEDIDGYPAGEDLSDLFFISTFDGDSYLANVKYPEMDNLNVFGDSPDLHQAIKAPVKEYFSTGTAPLMSLAPYLHLCPIDGYEYLTDGSHKIHIELPVIGINSAGEEESRVLKGEF